MIDTICVCRSCIDYRENRLMKQHGLTGTERCYMPRRKGAFVPKPGASGDISSSESMLIDLGLKPLIFIQGHRNCAAIRVLYAAAKRGKAKNDTEREFLRSHGHVADLVLNLGQHLTSSQQIKVLEEICVLASINNDMEHASLQGEYKPVFYALISETPIGPGAESVAAENIGLMIYDPSQGGFAKMPPGCGNVGIRIIDFVNPDMSRIDEKDGLGITGCIDLEVATRNSVRSAVADKAPLLKRKSVAGRPENSSVVPIRWAG